MEFWNSIKITCWKKSVYWHDRCSKYSSPRGNTIKEYIWFHFLQKIQICTQHIMSSSHSSFCIPHMWTQIFPMPACLGNPASLRSQKTSVHKAVLVSMVVLRMCKEDGEHWPHAVLGTVAQSSRVVLSLKALSRLYFHSGNVSSLLLPFSPHLSNSLLSHVLGAPNSLPFCVQKNLICPSSCLEYTYTQTSLDLKKIVNLTLQPRSLAHPLTNRRECNVWTIYRQWGSWYIFFLHLFW